MRISDWSSDVCSSDLTMQYIKPKIATLCIGQAASMGSLLLTAGEKGMRYALPNARVMIHQPSGGFQGQAADIEIHAREIPDLRARLNVIYARHTGQDVAAIETAMERDRCMTPEEAKRSAEHTSELQELTRT